MSSHFWQSSYWIALLVMVGTIGLGWVAMGRRAALGDMKLVSLTHDFGVIPTESTSEFTFVCRNSLPDTLVIDNLNASCGCTSAQTDRTNVGLGQDFRLTAQLSTSNYCGALLSHVTLSGHAAGRNVTGTYDLRADAENIIEFPELEGPIDLGTWKYGESLPASSFDVTRGKCPLKFSDMRVQSSESILSCEVKRVSNDEWTVSCVAGRATDALGATGCDLAFTFWDGTEQVPLVVHKQGYIELIGPVVASPPSILFTVGAGQTVHQELTIKPRDAVSQSGDLHIKGASASSKNVVIAKADPTAPNCVELDYKAPMNSRTDRGNILVSLLFGGQPYTLKVSYLAVIAE